MDGRPTFDKASPYDTRSARIVPVLIMRFSAPRFDSTRLTYVRHDRSAAEAPPDGDCGVDLKPPARKQAKWRDHWDHRASREASSALTRGAPDLRSGPIDACQQRAKSAKGQMALKPLCVKVAKTAERAVKSVAGRVRG